MSTIINFLKDCSSHEHKINFLIRLEYFDKNKKITFVKPNFDSKQKLLFLSESNYKSKKSIIINENNKSLTDIKDIKNISITATCPEGFFCLFVNAYGNVIHNHFSQLKIDVFNKSIDNTRVFYSQKAKEIRIDKLEHVSSINPTSSSIIHKIENPNPSFKDLDKILDNLCFI